MFNNDFFSPENHDFFFLDNVAKYCRAGQATDDTTAHAHFTLDKQRIQTHPEYVIIISFPLQQWLQERALMLRYTYIACLVNYS